MTTIATSLTERPPGPEVSRTSSLRMLLVEDDFASRLLLHTFLSRCGDCHAAINGRKALEALDCGGEDHHDDGA